MRSPNWTTDELKLALELYLTLGAERITSVSKNTQEIKSLSAILRGLDSVPAEMDEKYRSANSVHLKLMNFHSVNSSYERTAMSNVGALDKEIWNKYHANIGQLRKEVKEYIGKHFTGKKTNEINAYIERLEKYDKHQKHDSSNTPNDFLSNARSTVDYLEYLITKQSPSEQTEKLLAICSDLRTTLDKCEEDLTGTTESNYQQHGGINQKPLNDGGDKIGKHVCITIERLISEGLIVEKVVDKLTDGTWCKSTFRIGYPLLRRVVEDEPLDSQRKNKDGYLRYYKKIYEIDGVKFLLCKEWFESSRKRFDSWVESLYESNTMDLSEKELGAFLNALKIIDTRKVCIEVSDIADVVHENPKKHLDKLVDMGVLDYYQGTRSQYVIDDYDILYAMMSNVSRYSRRKNDKR